MRRVACFAVLMVLPLLASAKSEFAVDVERADFEKQKQSIEQALTIGEDLREISSADRAEVLQGLAKIEAQLADVGVASALEQTERQQVLAEQEAINKRLARAMADSRLVCERVQVIGSNMVKRTCTTVAAKKRQYELTQGALNGRDRPAAQPMPGQQ